MTPQDFANLSDLVSRRSALVLPSDKKSLAGSRLAPVARLFGFRNVSALLAELPYPSEELARAVTEAMTTNETSFFRDRVVFEHFAHRILPSLLHSRADSRRIRIWCAAAATGQEAYSLAMILDEAGLAQSGWKIDLIATDLSESAIARAKEGLYGLYEIERGLSLGLLDRHFVEESGQWRIADRLRRMVGFRSFNLLDHFGWLGEIDVIFCRNVLLYIESRARIDIQSKLAQTLSPDGHLFLGANELAAEHFAPALVGRGVFVKAPAPRARGRAMFR